MGHYLLSSFGTNSSQLTELMITVESHPLSFPLTFFLSFFLYLPPLLPFFVISSLIPIRRLPSFHVTTVFFILPSLAPSLSIFIYPPLGFLRFNQILCFPPSLFFSNYKRTNLQISNSLTLSIFAADILPTEGFDELALYSVMRKIKISI